MMQLTKAEEQVMQAVWQLHEGSVQDIREVFEEPRPARTTIATMLNILENKGFVNHKSFGRVHVYYPAVSRESYSKSQLFGVMKNYFNNSFASMAHFFAKEKNLSLEQLQQLLEDHDDKNTAL